MKILYVCPFAHYPGHYTWAARREAKALMDGGADVTLLTPWKLIDDKVAGVHHVYMHSQNGMRYHLVKFFRKWVLTRWVVMFFETWETLSCAIAMRYCYGYDVIHLRDGEPFFFLPHLLSIRHKGIKWAMWLTASNIYPPAAKGFQVSIYRVVIRLVNNDLWKPFYRFSMSRNEFAFMTENETAKNDYEAYLGGIFKDKVFCVPLGTDSLAKSVSKDDARKRLGLPQGKPMILSFGAPHSGKNVEVIFRALHGLEDVCLVHAGTQAFGLGTDNADLAKIYNRNGVVIRDCYIPEEDKPYYFWACDAMILSYKRHFQSTSSLLWEACRFDTPVISSDNPQLAEMVKGYNVGTIFRAEDAESLRDAVMRFVKIPDEQVRLMKLNCRRFVNEYSMNKWMGKCIEVYQYLNKKE